MKPVLFILSLGFVYKASASIQSIAVTGQLMCHGQPANDVKVKLYDENTITLDNKLDEQRTDDGGYFTVEGSEKSAFTLNPKINVYHNCHYWNPLCSQKFTIHIPTSYITKGGIPRKVFDAGRFNLEAKFPGQSMDCINK
uniref:Transthyretin-like family protein n=1 Tax=Bursaphelenchus xylophilus TaxID=6326 RepID=A0A1I7RWB9_BURXY